MYGIDRQVYYRGVRRKMLKQSVVEQAVQLVHRERMLLPRLGTIKLYFLLSKELQAMKVGRDKFFDILRANHLLIMPKKHITKPRCRITVLENTQILLRRWRLANRNKYGYPILPTSAKEKNRVI